MVRSLLALAAAAGCSVAALVPPYPTENGERLFFGGLALAALVMAAGLSARLAPGGRVLAGSIAGIWTVLAISLGFLLVQYQVACGCSGPVLPPAPTYLGLTATAYHLLALYGSVPLVIVAAFGRGPVLDRGLGRRRHVG